MKKHHLFSLLFTAFVLLGCGDNAEHFINWDSDNNGTLEVTNTSNKDIVVFHGQVPNKNTIMGGVRAQTTKNFDVSKYVSDFSTGGWMILRGMTRDEFNNNELNLSAAKVEFSAMATYRAGQRYRITIDYNFTGDNAFRVTNNSEFGLELRRNSPEGEKIAYLPKLSVNNVIYTQTTEAITLFPVYVFYNRGTQTVTTLNATSLFESVTVAPRPATGPSVQTYVLPNNLTLTWANILSTLTSPVAYIRVINNVPNQAAYFTNATATTFKSQSGYDAIGSGEPLDFEVEATEEGMSINLVATLYGGRIPVPVRYRDDTYNPVIRNGYEYEVSIDLYGLANEESSYSAVIREVKKRSLSDQLESL